MTPPLTITLLPARDGQRFTVTVNGPLRDKLLCMKMLAQAIVLVEEYQEEPVIVRAETIPVVRRNQG